MVLFFYQKILVNLLFDENLMQMVHNDKENTYKKKQIIDDKFILKSYQSHAGTP
jgi:hypothetical protein